MPDLITHVAFCYFLKRPYDLIKRQSVNSNLRVLFYLGTILPDILTRPLYILFPSTHDYIIYFHTPAVMFLVCGLVALLFSRSLWKRVFLNLISGAGLHFLLDSFQYQIYGNNYWLFPFSWKSIGIGLFYPANMIKHIPIFIAMIVFLELILFLIKKKNMDKMNN